MVSMRSLRPEAFVSHGLAQGPDFRAAGLSRRRQGRPPPSEQATPAVVAPSVLQAE
jgi:hypothetical protein